MTSVSCSCRPPRSRLRTCISPDGGFICAFHRSSLNAINLRETRALSILGKTDTGEDVVNSANFPDGDVAFPPSTGVYEIPNPFPFWGATYILQGPADLFREDPSTFRFIKRKTSEADNPLLKELLRGSLTGSDGRTFSISDLPCEVLLALAQTSRDPMLLEAIAGLVCDFLLDETGSLAGIRFTTAEGKRPVRSIQDHLLYETLGNNPALPDRYKRAMLLVPGIQGESPILGEYRAAGTHVWEYVRANSYIPWGHYAANMAEDSIRYQARDLSASDMTGLRHLYYQRVVCQMAAALGIPVERTDGKGLSPSSLESMREKVLETIRRRIETGERIPFTGTLWGWNYGYDISPSLYRLHASHQQIHQQYALIPPDVAPVEEGCPLVPTYAIGDQVADFVRRYREDTGRSFFEAYLDAIRSNKRLDGRTDLPSNLVLFEDDYVVAHVPKAQRSQGEIQIMVKKPVGNVLEADEATRSSLDMAILRVIHTLDALGAEMVTCYEVSKRFDALDSDQRLFLCLLPRHFKSPGAFSERQERWITGHYPEDYAEAARLAYDSICKSRRGEDS
ncbi:MAG: hypothetical protein K6360_08875 [Deltaproteobacteria bacterium]